MHLYLIGYRGSGKTTLAKQLAVELSLPWHDSDKEVESYEKATIREIFEKHGETGFRDREVASIDRLSQQPDSVIALGGGAVLRPKNRQTLKRTGYCVWLTAQPEELFRRIQGDSATAQTRPALTALGGYDEIKSLLTRREPLYREVAEKTLETDRIPPDELVKQIANWYRLRRTEE